MTAKRPRVAVVDDDESLRESLPDLLKILGYSASAFHSAEAFLASGGLDEFNCVLLDVAMPGMTGPELQEELIRQHRTIPIVFISAQGDDTVRRRVVARGAAAYLQKPFSESSLIGALNSALGGKDR